MLDSFGSASPKAMAALEGVVDALIEFYKRIGGPEALLKFISGNELAGFFKENEQHRIRLVLKLDADPLFAQLPGSRVQLKDPKPHRIPCCSVILRHERPSARIARESITVTALKTIAPLNSVR